MKTIRLVFSILFILICCFPVFTMPLFADNSNAEKREETTVPEFITQGGINWNFPSELDDYLSGHFSFRTDAVTLMSIIKAELGVSAQDKIIVGKNDWLFFAETLDDYTVKNSLSDYDIQRLAKTLRLINEYVESKGGNFAFAVAPNKNSVYPEYMPYYYIKSETPTNLERLNETLKNDGFNVDLLSALKNAKGDELLYHKRDSHWNNLGAAVGFNAIADVLGKSVTDYSALSYKIENTWRGDLDDMIFPTLSIKDNQIVFQKEYNILYNATFKNVDDLIFQAGNKKSDGKLYIYRDSFGRALVPMLAEEYKLVEFSRVTPYRLYEIEYGSDVIIEIAERNIKNLLNKAPLMSAPERASAEGLSKLKGIDIKISEGKLLEISAALPDNIDLNKVLISVTAGQETKFFEPFPIYSENDTPGNGVTMYIESLPENAVIEILG